MTEETIEEFKERIFKEYGSMYYDRQGNPIDMSDWGEKCLNHDYKVVKQEYIDKYFISTVWIGLNMQMFRQSSIKIFETMIFIEEGEEDEKDKDDLYLYQERYSTEEEAIEGHEIAVSLVRASLSKPIRIV